MYIFSQNLVSARRWALYWQKYNNNNNNNNNLFNQRLTDRRLVYNGITQV